MVKRGAALLEGGDSKGEPAGKLRVPRTCVISSQPNARTTVSCLDCSQYFPIYNWPENLQCLSALGDIWRGMNTQLFWVGEVSAARLSLQREGWLGAFPPTPSEVLGSKAEATGMDSGLEASHKLGKMVPCQQGSEDVTAASAGQCELQSLSSALFSFKTRTRSAVCIAQSLLKNLLHTEPWEVTVLHVYFFVKMQIIFWNADVGPGWNGTVNS